MRQLWVGSSMLAGHRKSKALIRSLVLSQTHTLFSGEEGLEIELLMDYTYIASIKIPEVWGSGNCCVGEHIRMSGMWCTPTPYGQRLFICILYHTIYYTIYQ